MLFHAEKPCPQRGWLAVLLMPILSGMTVVTNGWTRMSKVANLRLQVMGPEHDWVLPAHQGKAIPWLGCLKIATRLAGLEQAS